MIYDLIAHPETSLNLAGFLLWQTLKVAVVLASGYLIVVSARRASSAQHDLILRIAVVTALTLPLISLFVPHWDFALGNSLGRVWQSGIVTYDISSAVAEPAGSTGHGTSWPVRILLLWISGVGLILTYLTLGMLSTASIVRRARPITDPGLVEIVDTMRQRFSINRPVRLVVSSRVRVPFTCGIFRPAIILPEPCTRWHAHQIRFVLLHELAHVRRFDTLWYILVSVTAATYWMNPLVWMVKKRLLIESEKTCDDHVLCAGSDGKAYAQHLLEVLRILRPGRLVSPVGVSMARRSHLEDRLMSILSDRQRSATLKRSLVVWVTILTLAMVLPLAGLTLSASDQGKEKEKAATASDEKLPGPDQFVPVDSGPTLTYQKAPEYPKEARKEGAQGAVWIKALIDKQGKVVKAMVGKSSGHQMLDDAALKAAYLNEYSPAMQKDKPVAVWIKYKVDFKLDGSKKESTGGS